MKSNFNIFVESKLGNTTKDVNDFVENITNENNKEIITLDAASTTVGLKEIIFSAFNELKFSGFGKDDVKFLIIKNFDMVLQKTQTSLLKFLEEIPQRRYIIFICKNISNVLPTIISRAHVKYLTKYSEEFKKEISNYNLSKKQEKIVSLAVSDLKEISNFIEQKLKTFEDIVNPLIEKDLLGIKKSWEKFMKLSSYEMYLIISIVYEINPSKKNLELLNNFEWLKPSKNLLFDLLFSF